MPGPALAAPLFAGLTVGQGIGIGSAVLGGLGSLMSGIQQSQADSSNAAAYRQQAEQTQAEYGADAAQQARDNTRKLGAAEAAFGAAGVDLQGSPLDVLSDMATEGELSRRLILYKGNVEANKLRTQASIASSSSSSDLLGGIVGAGTTFLTQGLSFFGSKVQPTAPAGANSSPSMKVPGVPRPVPRPQY